MLAFSTLEDEHIDEDVMHCNDVVRVGPTYHQEICFNDELGSFDD
jgi:hypothetical protein